jgi:hypothetical protein
MDREELIRKWLNQPAQQQEKTGVPQPNTISAPKASRPTGKKSFHLTRWWKEELIVWLLYWTPYWFIAAMFFGTGYFGGVFLGYVMGGIVMVASLFALFLRVPHYLFLRWATLPPKP